MAKTKTVAEGQLTAYCMKTKEKGVPIQGCVIDVKNGRYIAKGNDGKGNTITSIVNGEKAKAAIEAGHATAGTGWPKASKK